MSGGPLYTSTLLLLVIFVFSIFSSVIREDRNYRIDDHQKYSAAHHFMDTDGDDREQEHNVVYDHQAFLGHEHAENFDDSLPAESLEKLGLIYDKIDVNQDGEVTKAELTAWIEHVQSEERRKGTNESWESYKTALTNRNTLMWDDFFSITYGSEHSLKELDDRGPFGERYRGILNRDRRRWGVADVDNSGDLTFEEYNNYFNPQYAEHMRDNDITDKMEEMDYNKDGSISLEEFMEEIWPSHFGEEEGPDWKQEEEEGFKTVKDQDKDGVLNRKEIFDWIYPPDNDRISSEAIHLITESDLNEDGVLSKEEMVHNFQLFVGSKAVDYSDFLPRVHDEF